MSEAPEHRPFTILSGDYACLERDCEEYVDEDGYDDPGVERCSHITTETACSCSAEHLDEAEEFYTATNPWPCTHA